MSTISRTVAHSQAERAAEIDRAIEIGVREAVIFGREIGRHLVLRQAERIEIGREMAAHAIGADQHHRADRIARGARRCRPGWARRRGAAGLAPPLAGLGAGSICVGSSAAVRSSVVGERPVRLRPARALHGAFQPLEPGAPARLDTVGRRLEPRIKRLDEGGAYPARDLVEILAFIAHRHSSLRRQAHAGSSSARGTMDRSGASRTVSAGRRLISPSAPRAASCRAPTGCPPP